MAMAGALLNWAISEREYLKDEIAALDIGAKLISPRGADMSVAKLSELRLRLEQVQKAIDEAGKR